MIWKNMEKPTYTFIAATMALITLLAGCNKQRDLYDTALPILLIESNWVPSLKIADMSGRATAMLYKSAPTKDNSITKEFFYHPNTVKTKVERGEYDVLLFNGMMFSEKNTNLDNIFFRNTDRVETFEAVVVEVAPSPRLVRAEGEYIASNDMELLTSAHTRTFVEGERQYFLKYKNGRNGFTALDNNVEMELKMMPVAISYPAQVIVHLINPKSAAVANGALRGFTGSAFMASGKPNSDFNVTHHLKLNHLTFPNPITEPKKGTIESQVFVTFGPPLDKPERHYTFELSIILRDGSLLNRIFDVTDQVERYINEIIAYHKYPGEKQVEIFILIEIFLELPEVIEIPNGGGGNGGSSIGVNPWEDDEIIVVKIVP